MEDNNKLLSDTKILNIEIPDNYVEVLKEYFNKIESRYLKYYIDIDINDVKYDINSDGSRNEYIFLLMCANSAFNIICKHKTKSNSDLVLSSSSYLLSDKNRWKILVYKNMMFELPFTLKDIIFLPIKYIKKCLESNNYKRLTKTLIHEWIHISQREKLNIWDNYIKNNTNWKKIINSHQLFKILVDNKNIYQKDSIKIHNPDTLYDDFLYIYVSGDKKYFGEMFYNVNSGSIYKKWFEIINNVNNDSFLLKNIETDIMKEEHPFELYAYEISDNLII